MTNELQRVFSYEGQRVRTVVIDGQPWFVAKDVCDVLGHTNSRVAVQRLDEDEKGVSEVYTPGGPQDMQVVNEPGLYDLIIRSNKPEARRFRRWVTHEVLPQIRRTGSYGVQVVPDMTTPEGQLAVAEMLLEQTRARVEAEERLMLQAPKVDAYDTLISAEGDYSVREAAQLLSRDPAIKTGQNRLFGKLRELGWIDRKGLPYQRHIDAGRLKMRTRTYDHPHTGEPTLSHQVRVTPKGLAELHLILGGSKQSNVISINIDKGA